MSVPARAVAQRIYFHSRAGNTDSFRAWSEAFERGDLEPTPPQIGTTRLRVV